MDDLPIDIHISKLLDWLISRRHCNQQWQENIFVIREKINLALQDMPAVDEILQLLQGTYINYFHCLRILELLKETEADTKNIFGWYSSQRMKDWQEICRLYEKDGIYLAEAANLLMRNVNYEIPALKKQMAKCRQQQLDYARKEGEYAGNAAELREKFNVRCRQIGIEGKRVKTELMALVKDMPKVYDDVVSHSNKLTAAVEFYLTFIKFLLPKTGNSTDRLHMLQYVIAHGNKTTYEWRTGNKPTQIIEPTFDIIFQDEVVLDSTEETTGANDDIDWGAFDVTDEQNVNSQSEEEKIVGLDDIETSSTPAESTSFVHLDIEIINDDGVDLSVSDVSHGSDNIVRGKDAYTVLDNVETRNIFINNLLELESFFTQRLAELNSSNSYGVSGQLQFVPNEIQRDVADLQKMLIDVKNVLVKLTAPHMVDLLLIRTSPKFVERLAGSLQKINADAEKSMSFSRLMAQRRQEVLGEEKAVQPKLEIIIQKTKELQKQIENQISKKYNNRRVNIMGEINMI